MNKFYPKMQFLEKVDLIKVLYLRDEYEVEAVEAAETVLQEREVFQEEIDRTIEQMKREESIAQKIKEHRLDKINALLNFSSFITFGYKADLDGKQMKRFKLFTIGLIGYYILFLYFNLSSLVNFIQFVELSIVLPILIELTLYGIVFPIGIYHFAKLNKIGWILVFYLLMNKLLLQVLGMVYMIKYIFTTYLMDEDSMFSDFLPQPNYAMSLFVLVAFTSMVWFLMRGAVLKVLKVSRQDLIFHLVGSVVFTILFFVITFYLML